MYARILVAVVCLLASASADNIPANCTYEDVRGEWVFQIGEGGNDRTLNCTGFNSTQKTLKVNLLIPDRAVDEYGNEGFWTVIHNQGFEVVISERKYFAFSKYKQDGPHVESYCDQTLPGWSHDTFGRDWACYTGMKTEQQLPKVSKNVIQPSFDWKFFSAGIFVDEINKKQKSWKATEYGRYKDMDLESMTKMAGGRKSRVSSVPKPAPVTSEQQRMARELPAAFDWRSVKGHDYVSRIRNQGVCGSSYAFSATGMNEARVRIMTNNTLQPVFSPQDIVDCSEYSQGCDGGFPYLAGGKYAEDFGLVLERCHPYTGQDGQCNTSTSCPRVYSTKYEYVGGFYGACNEPLMRINLVKYGPMSVTFMVHDDFLHYKSGVYYHTSLVDEFSLFEMTNHAVLLVGYGTDTTDVNNPQDYWIVKNSWGLDWGEEGFFRIHRGNDECSIESIAVQSTPIIPA